MAVAASQILARVRSQLIDEGTTQRWSDAELLRHLSDGQRAIAAIDPSAAQKMSVVKLSSGVFQTLPDDGRMLLRLIRNMGTDGTMPGRVVRLVSREQLDAQSQEWHKSVPHTEVRDYMYDPQDEDTYYVWPPSNGSGYVQLSYCFNPPEVVSTSTNISVRDIFQTPLFDYIMWRSHLKDSEMSSNSLASTYFQAFTAFMQARATTALANSPNQALVPTNLAVTGAAK